MEIEAIFAALVATVRQQVRSEVIAQVREELRAEMNQEAERLGPRFLKIEDVCRKLACSESGLFRLRHSSRGFPKPRLGVDGSPRWLSHEIETWMDRHLADF